MKTASITVRAFGTLRTKIGSDQKVTISENEPVQSIARRLSIDFDGEHLYIVNGEQTKPEALLHDGDVLVIISPISGG